MDEGSLSRGGGNFVLSEMELALKTEDSTTPIELVSAVADFAQKNFEATKVIDGKDDTGWAVEGKTKKEKRMLLISLKSPIQSNKNVTLIARLKHTSKHEKHVMGRFRLSTT